VEDAAAREKDTEPLRVRSTAAAASDASARPPVVTTLTDPLTENFEPGRLLLESLYRVVVPPDAVQPFVNPQLVTGIPNDVSDVPYELEIKDVKHCPMFVVCADSKNTQAFSARIELNCAEKELV
jgi:hypothetical protein